MIRTQRNGRWGKWHKAHTWAGNDAFWLTSCGMGVVKRASVSEVYEKCPPDDICRRCRESLNGDTSVTRVSFAAVQVEVEGDMSSTLDDIARLLGAIQG